MEVGIIGGGLSGLVCAWRLTQKGIKSIIFEKESLIGGRVPFCGAVATERFQPRLISLIKELGLEALKLLLSKKEEGFILPDGSFLGLESLPKYAMKQLGFKGSFYFMKISRFVNKVRFDVTNPDPKLVKLRDISLDDYLKDYPEKIRKIVIEPMLIFAFETDFKKISADYGLSHLRLGNELGSGKAFTFEESSVMALTNILEMKIREAENEVLTLAKVKRVRKEGEKFVIYYEQEFYGKEKEKAREVDKVVFSVPLFIVQEIFPELELESDVEYRNSKCLVVDGELKWEDRKFIIGMPNNPFNLRALFNVIPFAQLVYPLDETKPVNLDKLYKRYKIVQEKKLVPAMPVIGPKAKVPEVKSEKIEGVYLCGDFYYYPWLETAVTTAQMVAEMINK
jgi:protoporphyrinogen oxidase